jgi:hypothetical protein
MIYELSEGYAIDDACVEPTSVSYSFAFDMPQNIIEEYAGFVCINDKQIPEMGSRVFDNIFVVEEVVESEGSAKTLPAQMIVMDWHEIQEGNYRYIAWLENDTFCVRIVIHDFLYAEIMFDRA